MKATLLNADKYNESFILSIENVYSKEWCEGLIEDYKQSLTMTSGFTTAGPTQRSDTVPIWRNKSTHIPFAFDYTKSPGAKKYIEDFFVRQKQCLELYYKEYDVALDGIQSEMFEIKVQEVKPGGGYHIWHCEHGFSTPTRLLATMVYLNTFPEGEATTEFLQQGLAVTPKQGTVLIWPAFFTHMHRGNPPYSHNKYTITSWYNMTNSLNYQLAFKH